MKKTTAMAAAMVMDPPPPEAVWQTIVKQGGLESLLILLSEAYRLANSRHQAAAISKPIAPQAASVPTTGSDGHPHLHQSRVLHPPLHPPLHPLLAIVVHIFGMFLVVSHIAFLVLIVWNRNQHANSMPPTGLTDP